MSRRLHATLVDYMVIAISPALIMLMVGSLVFFLLGVLYQGEFAARLYWTMTCFVFAAVLISRISIEEGFERAFPFGLALAVVVGIAASQFMEVQGTWLDNFATFINWGIIALIWWSAHRLTWDCTVIDDSEDASGEGLLQAAGLERSTAGGESLQPQAARVEGTSSREVPDGWWQRYVENQRRPHAPGVWVVYFSLAALPLFGLGQWLIPPQNEAARRSAFCLLLIYVASGLSLLVTTSFLGLRRYLRQRRLEMPAAMAGTWLMTGAAIIAVLLFLSALLPRPSAEYAISELPFRLGSPTNRASNVAPMQREGVHDETPGKAPGTPPENADDEQSPPGTQGEQAAEDGDPSDKGQGQSSQSSGNSKQSKGKESGGKSSAKSDDQSSQGDSGGSSKSSKSKQDTNDSSQSPTKGKAEKQKNTPQSDDNKRSKKDSSSQRQQAKQEPQRSNPPPPSNPTSIPQPPVGLIAGFLALVFKWAIYVAVALAVLYAIWTHRAEILRAILDILSGIAAFFSGAWGSKRQRHQLPATEAAALEFPPRAFATFENPFAGGSIAGPPSRELVQYTFEAFEAWSREHGCPRAVDATPHELARSVSQLNAFIGPEARSLAELYSRAAYDKRELPANSSAQLEALWRKMESSTAVAWE